MVNLNVLMNGYHVGIFSPWKAPNYVDQEYIYTFMRIKV